MNWIQVSIQTTTAGIEPVCGRLYTVGITGTEIEDAADFNDFLENDTKYWDYVDESLMYKKSAPTCVKLYVSENESGHEQLMLVRQSMEELKALDTDREFGTLEITLKNMQEQDWSENWKQYYQPFPVGETLYVVPEWMRGEAVPAGRQPVYLNPGLIFGTGSHGTTRLCMEGVERYVKSGDRMLDLGTGSGILAIAAVLLGAKEAIGCDIDPKASRVAAENASYNGIGSDRFRCYTGDINQDLELKEKLAGTYDLVVANIIADVIIPLTAVVGDYLTPDGLFLTSGIIEHRAEDVKNALEAHGFEILETRSREGWVSYTAKQKA